MAIIRITQAKSLTHTEFHLMPDYVPVPRVNFELAKEWAEKGMLTPFDSSFIMLLENQRKNYAAIRRITEGAHAAHLQLVP
jgi:hypothetical protein